MMLMHVAEFHRGAAPLSPSTTTFVFFLICTMKETEKTITCLHRAALLVWTHSSVCPVCPKAVTSMLCCSKVLWSRKLLSWEHALRRREGDTLNSPCLCRNPFKFCPFFFFWAVRNNSSLVPWEFSRLGTSSCATPPSRGGIPRNSTGAWLTDCHKIQLWRGRSAWHNSPRPEANVMSEEMDFKVIRNRLVQNQKSCRWCRLLKPLFPAEDWVGLFSSPSAAWQIIKFLDQPRAWLYHRFRRKNEK